MLSRRNVLVLDADPLIGRVLQRILAKALPVEIRWVPDAPSALTMLEQWTPDVLIADFVDSDLWTFAGDEVLGPLEAAPISAWQLALSYVPLVMAWRARIAPRRAPILAMGDRVWPLPPSLRHDLGVVAEFYKPTAAAGLIHAVTEACDASWIPVVTHPRDGIT